ncbi:hypothetical protein BH11ACT3_BH11ACT3_02560 [soil metagenome]
MRTTSRLRLPATLILAGTLVIAGPLALSGCGLIGGVVNSATGGGGLPGVPGTSVPADFPSDVPLIDGDVQLGISLGDSTDGKAWNVTIKTADTNAAATIKSQMEDAGFESQEVATSTDGTSAAYVKDTLGVLVVVAPSDGAIVANYTVTLSTESNK